MHELAYAQDIITIIEEKREQEKFVHVKNIKVKVGKFCGIEPDSLEFCFELCSKGTVADGAKLEIDVTPFRIFCRVCKEEYEMDKYIYSCPVCSGSDVVDVSGREIKLSELEVE